MASSECNEPGVEAKPPTWRLRRTDVACLAILFTAVLSVQWSGEAYQSELARHPDEAAHFITGALVYDYFRTGFGTNPLAFAVDYYAHFPKVAVGHWPPAFHAYEALGFAAFGLSKATAFAAVGLGTFLIVANFFVKTRPSSDMLTGLVMALVLLGLRSVRGNTCEVMAETFLCLLCWLSVLAFAKFVADGKLFSVAAFGVWAALALLTKGNALALALLPGLALGCTQRWNLLRSRWLWLTGAAVAAATAPFYLYTYSIWAGANTQEPSWWYIVSSLGFYLWAIVKELGPALTLLVCLGALAVARERPSDGPRQSARLRCQVCGAWILAVILFHALFPLARDERYVLLAAPALMVLACRGLEALRCAVLDRLPVPAAVSTAVVGVLLLATLPGRIKPAIEGYAAVAEFVSAAEGQVVLISSGSLGEGAFIVERRLQDPSRTTYTLRASQLLGDSSWHGKKYRLRFENEAELLAFLTRTPIRFVVIDDFSHCLEKEEAHQEQLRQLVAAAPDALAPRGTFPIRWGKEWIPDGIRVYENLKASPSAAVPLPDIVARKRGVGQ